jgi:hydrogenase maturation protein HypF
LETVDYLIADWGPDHAAAWARQFHCCVADAAAGVAHRFAQQTGADAVIYSGGCFLNSLLCDMLDRRFERLGLRRVRSMRLRPGDQALALGQVVLADAELRTRGVNAT